MYIGDTMKKTEFITFRTDQRTKAALTNMAAKRKWTISLLVEEIIKEFVDRHSPSEIEAIAVSSRLEKDTQI